MVMTKLINRQPPENDKPTGMPAEVTAWGDAYTAKRQELKPSTIPATPAQLLSWNNPDPDLQS